MMSRNIFKRAPYYCLIPGLFTSDTVTNTTETEKKADRSSDETGWDRVKKMFETDEFGNVSDELHTVLHTAVMSSFVGALYGGVIHSRVAYMEFMRNNEATSFQTHLQAKQKLQDKVTTGFAKGAFKWGWRLSLLSTSIIGIATVVQTYRNTYGISEYALAGSISGALYKFNKGPKGWVSGGVIGGALGCFGGCLITGLLKLTGMSMSEARYWQYQWKKKRDNYYHKTFEKEMEKEDYAVIKLHNDEVGEKGKDLSNLDGK